VNRLSDVERTWFRSRLGGEQLPSRDSMDDTFTHPRFGTMAPRWAFSHMIAEYARHNGRADSLREQIDGTTRI
jgi:hypothetical protein